MRWLVLLVLLGCGAKHENAFDEREVEKKTTDRGVSKVKEQRTEVKEPPPAPPVSPTSPTSPELPKYGCHGFNSLPERGAPQINSENNYRVGKLCGKLRNFRHKVWEIEQRLISFEKIKEQLLPAWEAYKAAFSRAAVLTASANVLANKDRGKSGELLCEWNRIIQEEAATATAFREKSSDMGVQLARDISVNIRYIDEWIIGGRVPLSREHQRDCFYTARNCQVWDEKTTLPYLLKQQNNETLTEWAEALYSLYQEVQAENTKAQQFYATVNNITFCEDFRCRIRVPLDYKKFKLPAEVSQVCYRAYDMTCEWAENNEVDHYRCE